MALFSGKIIEAQYIDAEYSIVEVLYTGDDGNIYSHAIVVEPDNQDWKDLIEEGWDQEKLIEGTAEYKRKHSSAFNAEVHTAAKLMVDELLNKEKEDLKKAKLSLEQKGQSLEDLDRLTRAKVQDMMAEVWTHVVENNVNKDMLFKFKLWILEQDFIKDCSKEEKSSIRKAERVTQLFSLIDEKLK